MPQGLAGAIEPLKELYGDGAGGPDADKAKATLEAAGVTTPVVLNLQYNGDHYGPSSGDEYAAIKSQLEEGGLFTVNLAQTEYVQYVEGPHGRRLPGRTSWAGSRTTPTPTTT